MKKGMMLDGLHQYTMAVFSSLVSGGLSERQAKAEVTKLLLKEITYFDSKIEPDTNISVIIEKVLGRKMTEEERFRLYKED